jgi:hypothetical protein
MMGDHDGRVVPDLPPEGFGAEAEVHIFVVKKVRLIHAL